MWGLKEELRLAGGYSNKFFWMNHILHAVKLFMSLTLTPELPYTFREVCEVLYVPQITFRRLE